MSDNRSSFLSLCGKALQGLRRQFCYCASHFLFTVVSPLLTVRRTNASRISCAHEAVNQRLAQSAEGDSKKRRAWGVSLMRWLGSYSYP
jgi:hypothetical protein